MFCLNGLRLLCRIGDSDWFLVADVGNKIMGSIMIGYEGHRGWINYLAVDPSLRRQGVGRRLMEQAEELLRRAGCPKINLQVRSPRFGRLPQVLLA